MTYNNSMTGQHHHEMAATLSAKAQQHQDRGAPQQCTIAEHGCVKQTAEQRAEEQHQRMAA
jgi:hypothetical protein